MNSTDKSVVWLPQPKIIVRTNPNGISYSSLPVDSALTDIKARMRIREYHGIITLSTQRVLLLVSHRIDCADYD